MAQLTVTLIEIMVILFCIVVILACIWGIFLIIEKAASWLYWNVWCDVKIWLEKRKESQSVKY